MKPIYLKKADALQEAVEAVNGRATSHTLSADDIETAASRAERQLKNSGIPKNIWRGVRVIHQPAGPGKAYSRKGRSVATSRATLEYRAGGWALVKLVKTDAWADTSEVFALEVGQDVLDRAIAEACKPYRVLADA